MSETVARLKAMSSAPTGKALFDKWLTNDDAIDFLKHNQTEKEFVVYAGLGHSFLHAVMVPLAVLDPPAVDDLLRWNFGPSSSWGVSETFSEPPVISVEPPLSNSGSESIAAGEQLIFARQFYGRPAGDRSYFEILQKFVHVMDLHFVPERSSFCRLDKHGDIEDVVRIVTVVGTGRESGTIITVDHRTLEGYAALTDAAVVRMFDFRRYQPSHFSGWSGPEKEEVIKTENLFYRSRIAAGHASFVRGCQIIRPSVPKAEAIPRFGGDENSQFASFITWDWKNGVVAEVSCGPGATANYFTESNLPFEVSPAFFRPEVLLKYKMNTDKYDLRDRSIVCRGTWHLETYDINEAGQVHTYLVYLRSLPYEEQLYWKSFNEPPKGSISKRAFTTDFQGQFYEEYDALRSLKSRIHKLAARAVPWWKLRSEALIGQVHYPVTTSPDEWTDALLRLDQLVVEGFEERELRRRANALGRSPDLKWRSLRLTEECLHGLGFDQDHAKQICEPLRKLNHLRVVLKAHAGGEEARALHQRALAEHGTFRRHFEVLCRDCDEALRTIEGAFEDPRLAGP